MSVSPSVPGGRSVFLVHGRDQATREALISLLRAFDLRVIRWRDAAAHAGGGTPYTGDIVAKGMELADAVIVLLTPDDIGYVHPVFREHNDEHDELEPTGQARLNVIFEAGMAMARDRDRVVVVEYGRVRKLSDTAGLNVIRMDGSVERRRDLAGRLRSAGLAVDTDGEEWRTAGSFDPPPADRDESPGSVHQPAAELQPRIENEWEDVSPPPGVSIPSGQGHHRQFLVLRNMGHATAHNVEVLALENMDPGPPAGIYRRDRKIEFIAPHCEERVEVNFAADRVNCRFRWSDNRGTHTNAMVIRGGW
jgi:hypothetical protein